jgi:type IX secretion system PorP/SprF family membrane protein
MKKALIYLSGFMILGCYMMAQDHHLSHYDIASMYLNPASTGMYQQENNDGKLYLDHRSQWNSLGIKPYLTSYIAYDKPCPVAKKNTGFGFYIINNNNGIGNFNKFTFMASGAYDIMSARTNSAGGSNDHLLSVGIQAGFFYRSANPNSLNYDVQYSEANNGGFDKNISSNETYTGYNITRFDASFGIYYRYLKKEKKAHPYAGFSMSHLPRPNESLNGGVTRLPFKIAGYGGVDIEVNEQMDITPRVLYVTQAKAAELMAGVLFDYLVSENDVKVVAGFDYRLKDACIISLGLKHPYYSARFSYDFNTSGLAKYSSGRGAYELSMIYVIKTEKKQSIKSMRRY